MAEPYCEGRLVFLWLFELGSSKQSVPCSGTEGWSIILNARGQILQCNSTAQRVAKPWKLGYTAAQGQLTLIPNFSVGKNVENRAKCQCADGQDTLLGLLPQAVLKALILIHIKCLVWGGPAC